MELPDSYPFSEEIQEIKKKMPRRTSELLRDRNVNRHIIVVIAISLVEDYAKGSKIDSIMKVDIAWELLSHIAIYLQEHNLISDEKVINIFESFGTKNEFTQEVEAMIDIGNNPNLVSNSSWVEKGCCCFPCLRYKKGVK